MIKYLGSKRSLLGAIQQLVEAFPAAETVVDLFSGTSRVGHALKKAGYRVLANDHNRYAHLLSTCYVQADSEEVQEDAEKLIAEFNALRGRPGYFTETFCEKSRYFQPKNGERIDAIREAIAAKDLDDELEAVLIVSLMEAADRVDSTTGLQMAYLKQWAPRASNDLELRLPAILPRARFGKGEAHGMDVFDAVSRLHGDIVYLDPPYNQHSYLGNYHIWESLAIWDKPETYGVACKRLDCRTRTSIFNSKANFRAAIDRLISEIRAPVLIVSFNNEGFIHRDEIEGMLSRKGELVVVENEYKRYVGAQIGIYNPQGVRVGKVGHLRNKEFLYVVAQDAFRSSLDRIGRGRLALSA